MQKLEHCSDEFAKILHNHLKHSKLKIKGFGSNLDSREAVAVVVSSFTGHLGNSVAHHAAEIFKIESIDTLTAYVRVSFSNEDLEGINLYSLIKFDQFDKYYHEYTQEFDSSYPYWKDDISVKAASYLYIRGLRVGALRADLMTNWQIVKYDSLIDLHNIATKNSSRRSAAINTPRNGSSATTQNNGKAHVSMPSYKRLHGSIGQSSHKSFGGNRSKGASSSKIT